MVQTDTADLGITAGDLVNAARLKGPLSRPELGLDAKGTVKAGLKLYGAIATGGSGSDNVSKKQSSEEDRFLDKLKGLFGN